MDYHQIELELADQIETFRRKIPYERWMVSAHNPLAAPSIHAQMIASESSLREEIDEACRIFGRDKSWPDLTQQVRELVFVRLLSLRTKMFSPSHNPEIRQQIEALPYLAPQEYISPFLLEWWQSGGRDRWMAQKVAFEDAAMHGLPPDTFSQRQ